MANHRYQITIVLDTDEPVDPSAILDYAVGTFDDVYASEELGCRVKIDEETSITVEEL